ncbi:MAG: tRNA (adenosine(37)-N6)-dimethylallyltransferase MiaA [Limisphaerales bacterium]
MHDGNAAISHAPVFLAGPTAVGKSVVALALAELLGGEIISVDSMQVYRGLDIGTAKPSPAERARVPHHLLDVVELTESFDAAKFLRLAGAAVRDIQGRGRAPVFCGGTGLYFRAWLEGLGEAPPADPQVRAELEAMPLAELLAELERRDPETFAWIDRRNPRRVVRALEVVRLTGRPFSTQRARWNAEPGARKAGKVFVLDRDPADLRARIEARVEAMFAAGLVDETRRLLADGLERNPTAMQAIGYRQVVEHLRGERGLAETVVLVKTRTWQFARRQGTWFRRQMPVERVPLTADSDIPAVSRDLLARHAAGAGIEA